MNDPLDLLIDSFEQAKSRSDPNAHYCVLTTLDETGFPVTRTVTTRQMHPGGILIYVNEHSPKVDQLRNNPDYELLFFWPSLLRQFRVRGGYAIFASENQRRAWQRKPRAGQLYDLFQSRVQQQSSVLPSREVYVERAEKLKQHTAEHEHLQMPPEQLSLRFEPHYIESWIASMHDRLHDRRRYRLTEQGWSCEVLVP